MEASRAERLRLNGNGALTLEDARTWIEETGLCLFLPRRQFSVGVAPSFVEAISGTRNPTPDPKHIALAEELLVRLETDGVAVRLNLLGHPGEQPDFVVATWVLPYVYALRGDRDWRRSPQLTGSRQVSQLAIQAYKQLEAGDATIPQLKHTLGREVTEAAVLRAITELWQQLRIIPIVSAPGKPAHWQLLRQRFQKAIAEGASTSQVTAISVLASIYLQAVIAASMEEVELFLAPLTARSKVREVLRGLVATRQVHTISLGHAPHFYVAGTLPEFTVAPTIYASSAMAASPYFLHAREHEDEPVHDRVHDRVVDRVINRVSAPPAPVAATPAAPATPAAAPPIAAESHAPRVPAVRKAASNGKPAAARPHFSRSAARSRDRKPSQTASSSHPARRPSRETRPTGTRAASGNGSRLTSGTRWTANSNGNGHSNGNGTSRHNGTHSNGNHANGNGNSRHNGAHSNGSHSNGNGHSSGSRTGSRTTHAAAGVSNGRSGKSSTQSRPQRNGKSAAKPVNARGGAVRPNARPDARGASSRKPALTAGAKAGNSKRYGFTAPSKRGTKKRG